LTKEYFDVMDPEPTDNAVELVRYRSPLADVTLFIGGPRWAEPYLNRLVHGRQS
jgi:hypothetical protein